MVDVPAGTDARAGLAELIASAVARAQHATRGAHHAAGDRRLTEWLEGFERTYAPVLAPFVQQLLDAPDTPDQVKALLAPLAGPTHKFDATLIGLGITALVYPFIQAAVAPHVQSAANVAWSADSVMPLSPAEVALGQVKNTLGTIDPHVEAAKSGVNAGRYEVLARNTGEPIAIGEALLLYRRGEIDHDRVVHAIRQSRIRDEWTDTVFMLRYAPPGAGEVITALLKGHLSEADAAAKLGAAGIDPANLGWLHATAGRPPGTHEMLELWNRGEIDEGRVEQSVRQSDINTDYIDDIKKLRWYLPPVRSVVALHNKGAIDDTRARTLLVENGVRPEDIDGYLVESTTTRKSTVKELSQSQVVRLYERRMIDRPTASARLASIGYHADDANLLLDLTDDARHHALLEATVRKIGTLYIAHKISKSEAANQLGAAQVPSAAQLDLFHFWDVERAANVHEPTVTQVLGAYRRTEINAAETKRRLLGLGVQQTDLRIIVADAFPPTRQEPTKVDAVVNA